MAKRQRIEDFGKIVMVIERIHDAGYLHSSDLSEDDFVDIHYDRNKLEELYIAICGLAQKINQIELIARGEL